MQAQDLIINGVSTIAVIWVFIQAIKRAKLLNTAFAPLVAIVIGVLVSAGNALAPAITGIIVLGIFLGGAATITFDGFKRMEVEKKAGGGQ